MKQIKKAGTLLLIVIMFVAFMTANAENGNNDPIELFKAKKCNSCHSIKVLGIEKKNKKSKGTDLSYVGSKYEAPFLMDYLQKKVEINGKKHGIKFRGSDEELTEMIGFLMSLRTEDEDKQ